MPREESDPAPGWFVFLVISLAVAFIVAFGGTLVWAIVKLVNHYT